MTTSSLYFVSSVSGSCSTPGNALGAPDGVWTTDANAATNWTHRWQLDTVSGSGSPIGTQSVTLRLRKGSNSGNPTVTSVTLYQAGSSLGALTLITGSTTISSTTGQDLVYQFDGSLLSGLAEVDVEIVTTSAGGGPSARNAVAIDAGTWLADYSVTLAANATGLATATANLVGAADLAANATGQAEATADLTKAVDLGANATGQTTASATVDHTVAVELGANATGQATAAADLNKLVDLGANATGQADSTADLNKLVDLGANATGQADAAADLTRTVDLGANATGQATAGADADLVKAAQFGANATGQATATADLTKAAGLGVNATGQADATADLNKMVDIGANATGQATATADLTRTADLVANATGQADATADIAKTADLGANATGQADAAADLTRTSALGANATGQATATADLSKQIDLGANATGQADANAEFRQSGDMVRLLTPALAAEVGLTVTRPGYLVRMEFATELRFSTLGAVRWGGQSWETYDVKVQGLTRESNATRTASLSLGNLTNEFGAIVLSNPVADVLIEIYAVYAGAPNDAVLEFSGVGDSCEVGDRVVINLVGQSTQRNFSPRRRISAATGFNTLLPAGTVLSLGGSTYLLERS